MPQPIKGPHDIGFGIAQLRSRPEHMKLVGLVSAEWAMIELQLYDIFVLLCGRRLLTRLVGEIFDGLESLSLRLDLVGRFLRQQAPDFSDEFEREIRKKVRKGAGFRNSLIHTKWGVIEKFPDDLIKVSMTGDCARFSVKDLEDVLTRISSIQGDLGNFVVRVETAMATADGS